MEIGNKISGIIEVNKRKCFNCRVTQTQQWYNLLKEHYLCNECNAYKHKYGKFRSNEL
uniref:GATA-type domain-containing protein n=1 Tax=Meloidogyne incognita TaxID=6306 RepID=A0A914NY02_MELIC